MEIIKTDLLSPKKSKFGDFELEPEEGWKIFQSFIDYESKLLIVSVSIMDQTQWTDNGYGGRTIPTREYKIDVKTSSILEAEEWQKYFTYDKVETISEDKSYKLISQRIFDPGRNSDGFKEELYDLNTNKLISSGNSIAFSETARENLLQAFYRSIKEKEERKRALNAKPTLEQFHLKQIAELKDNDAILCYYDNQHVYQLNYVNKAFVLLKGGQLSPDNTQRASMPLTSTKSYHSIEEFWNDFINDKKWYLRFNFLNAHGRLSTKALLLAKHIVSFFNELRERQSFTYSEYNKIGNWSNLVWSDDYRQTELKQWCSNCLKEVIYQARYPKYICSDCASKDKLDSKGNLLEFSNLGFSGGFKITYMDIKGNTIREDDRQDYCDCIIDGHMFFAQEARFGGIVIQKKD
jgi:hypothetical protein